MFVASSALIDLVCWPGAPGWRIGDVSPLSSAIIDDDSNVVMSIKLTFYYFYPKSDYMLYHLQTKEQIKAWTDVYKNYKNAWKYSLIVSFIGYILISYGLNNY